MTDIYTTHKTVDGKAAELANHQNYSYLNWGAVFGGAVISLAVFILLSTFGAAIGLSSTSAIPGKGLSARAVSLATVLWIVWTVVTSFIVGAYSAGRLHHKDISARPHEAEIRDGTHGIVVWALVSMVMASLSAMSVVNATKALINPAIAEPYNYTIDKMLRPVAGNAVINAENRAIINRIMANFVTSGALPADDKTYLQTEVNSRTGFTPAEATKRVDDAVANINVTIERSKTEVEKARKTGILAAFLTVASLIIGAAAAWWAATKGGQHRDEELSMSDFASWNYRKSITQVRS